MIKIYVYNTSSGKIAYEDTGMANDVVRDIPESHDFTLTPPPDYNHVWRWVDTEWVELLPINNPNVPYSDYHKWDSELNEWVVCENLSEDKKLRDQEQVWDEIKQRRLEAVMSGVYVPSIDKWFHTDNTSSTTYATIVGMIALDNYAPLQWKVMDNTWVLLTVELFKELQLAMSLNTNAMYMQAEIHKAAMLQSDDPLEYDYSEGWA